jgi:hypothetical protein
MHQALELETTETGYFVCDRSSTGLFVKGS